MASILVFSATTDRWHLELRTRRASTSDDLEILKRALSDRSNLPLARWTCEAPATWVFPGADEQLRSMEVEYAPLVFENRQYLLRIHALKGAKLRGVSHPWSRDIDDGFDIDDNSCHASLRTGNDIGRFLLEITTEADGQMRSDRITWQIWPLKLDYGRDLKALTEAVEKGLFTETCG